MTDTELREINAKHFPAGIWGCRKCGLTPADAQCEAQELVAEVERLRGVVEAAQALDRCPECNVKALDCGHAEELHFALEGKG